ncbi:MAG: dihydropteroate synthase [Bacteroidia bacterium]|nr:MAG: dihydropteroate synthase [Bacteroidia bacterium]
MSEKLKILNDATRIKIMAILNYTNDSFYDGGQYNMPEKFFARAEQCIHEGADILDIGVASTRPGAPLIQPKQEWEILKPLLYELRKKHPGILISVDTYNSYTAEKSIETGADIINDISGGQFDKKMFDVVSNHKNIFYVIMHTPDIPEKMQQRTHYDDAVTDIKNYFSKRTQMLENKGFSNIIIDPGFGFGKTIEQNYELLNRLNEFKSLQKPILAGLSRKSMIYKKLKSTPAAHETLIGTITLNTLAICKGASIIRVHDVKEASLIRRLLSF